MVKFTYTITDPTGIHARPAGLLARKAAEFTGTTVTFAKGGKSADTRRIMALMALGIKGGDEITVTAEGGDENAAAESVKKFLSDNNF